MTDIDFSIIQKTIKVNFSSEEMLKQAFTHRSYLNEHRGSGLEHNERLEFLGDAVLELVVTRYLYDTYPKRPEGELTSIRAALVNTSSIAAAANEIGMNDFLLLSRGEAKDTGRARQYILANTFEAVIGAVYLDQGYDSAKEFIADWILKKTDLIVKKDLWRDAKSVFQEQAQEYENTTPEYKIIKEVGPDHAKEFTVGVYIGKKLIAEGSGFSKQEAETDAARVGLEKKGW